VTTLGLINDLVTLATMRFNRKDNLDYSLLKGTITILLAVGRIPQVLSNKLLENLTPSFFSDPKLE
jgi:hypothetical protein